MLFVEGCATPGQVKQLDVFFLRFKYGCILSANSVTRPVVCRTDEIHDDTTRGTESKMVSRRVTHYHGLRERPKHT